MENRITFHICTRDRHSELYGLLISLKSQTYQNFDIIILDDASGLPITQCQFVGAIINRLKLEGHKIKLIRNDISFGCCAARNKCIEEDDFNNPLTMRCDDDVILEKDYIEKLIIVVEQGYDMVSGVIPLLTYPEMKREVRFVKPIINEHKFDIEGNLTLQKDELGFCYIEDEVIPTHQFRTNCLYKSEINKKIKYETNLSNVAFREEGFFSFRAIIEGYKIVVNTGAVAYHLATQSGGNRCPDYAEKVKIDDRTFKEWCKKQFKLHGDFLNKYNQEVIKNGK